VTSGAPDRASELSVGVDLGGTNIRVALYRGLRALHAARVAGEPAGAPQPIAWQRELVGDEREPASVAAHLARMVVEVLVAAGATGAPVPVGVGVASMLRGHTGIVANAPNLGWRDVAFGALVTEALARELARAPALPSGAALAAPGPVTLFNDVNAITYGEYALGAAVGARDVLGVYVGTGIGGGIVADGRLIEGASNCAGEIGHFKVAYGDDAPPCGCGLRGCIEAFMGGVHLQERAQRELRAGARSAALRLAGGDPGLVHPGHIDMAAAEGDGYALDLYAEVAPLFAATLGNAINLLNPARLVLGGGVLSRAPVLREHVLTALQVAASRALLDPLTIVEPALGDDAGIVGSALLASERHG
jgi:glucokinase